MEVLACAKVQGVIVIVGLPTVQQRKCFYVTINDVASSALLSPT